MEIEIIGRKFNLLGTALSASEGRVSIQVIPQRPVLRVGDVLAANTQELAGSSQAEGQE